MHNCACMGNGEPNKLEIHADVCLCVYTCLRANSDSTVAHKARAVES